MQICGWMNADPTDPDSPLVAISRLKIKQSTQKYVKSFSTFYNFDVS